MRKVLHILGALEDVDLEWLLRHGRAETIAQDSVLIREGEPIAYLFIVLDGRFSVRTLSGPPETEIASLMAGEVVGEISFVDSRSPVASVVASQTCRVLAIPAMLLRNKLDRDSAFASRFYRAVAGFLADRLRITTGRLGYGQCEQDVDELDMNTLDDIAVAATRFEHIMSRMRSEAAVGDDVPGQQNSSAFGAEI